MATETEYMDEGSRLAAETRAALAAKTDLDRRGCPVPTSEREAAQSRIDSARAAEAAYWRGVSDV